jgi:hypothetical protein
MLERIRNKAFPPPETWTPDNHPYFARREEVARFDRTAFRPSISESPKGSIAPRRLATS